MVIARGHGDIALLLSEHPFELFRCRRWWGPVGIGTVAGTALGSVRDPGAPWRPRHGIVYSIIFSLARTKFRLRIVSFSSQCIYSRGCSSFVGAVCVVIVSSDPLEIPRQFHRTLSALRRDGPRPPARLLAWATIYNASEILTSRRPAIRSPAFAVN